MDRTRVWFLLVALFAVTVTGCGKKTPSRAAEQAKARREKVLERQAEADPKAGTERPPGKRGEGETAPSITIVPKLSEEQTEYAKKAGVEVVRQIDLADGVRMTCVLIPPGEFMMGSPDTEKERQDDEGPLHKVRISRPFYMAIYETTQAQYRAIMGRNPSLFDGDDRPVERLSWNNATEFCVLMSQKAGFEVRLPTEAEWEYACRAGTSTRFNVGDALSTKKANFKRKGRRSGETKPVGSYRPNRWGLYDMHGNVSERVWDWYDSAYYKKSPVKDPKGPVIARERVCRGGSRSDFVSELRSAGRAGGDKPGMRRQRMGFRVAVSLKKLKDLPSSIKEAQLETRVPHLANPSQVQSDYAKTSGLPLTKELDLGKNVKLKLILIPPGEFLMGSPWKEKGRLGDEGPLHRVRITKPFYMGVYELTQEQYEAAWQSERFKFRGRNYPADGVGRYRAKIVCRRISERTGDEVRLPSEAEWEYACRAGSRTRFHYGDDPDCRELQDYAWLKDNSGETSHPVGQKKPNAWGLYDMYGNVAESCEDHYRYNYYGVSPTKDPLFVGTPDSKYLVRGGSWRRPARTLRSAARKDTSEIGGQRAWGFRVLVEATLPFVGSEEQIRFAKKTGLQCEKQFDLGEDVTLKCVLIPPGEFLMGSPATEKLHMISEGPVHRVVITKPVYMGICEITQLQYQRVMGKNPSHFKGPDLPADSVSWRSASIFCKKLSNIVGLGVRLPSEAEWEYACRAGTTTKYNFGDDDDSLRKHAWDSSAGRNTHPVGLKPPNRWGLHDMHGNVAEWCLDGWAGSKFYIQCPIKDPVCPLFDPTGVAVQPLRIVRGGSYQSWGEQARCANRDREMQLLRFSHIGFRVTVEANIDD